MHQPFDELRISLTSLPVWFYPDFEKPFVVETDASSVSVGAVLAQTKSDGKNTSYPVREPYYGYI